MIDEYLKICDNVFAVAASSTPPRKLPS